MTKYSMPHSSVSNGSLMKCLAALFGVVFIAFFAGLLLSKHQADNYMAAADAVKEAALASAACTQSKSGTDAEPKCNDAIQKLETADRAVAALNDSATTDLWSRARSDMQAQPAVNKAQQGSN